MSILEDMGLDPDEVSWQDLAACKNIVQEYYVDVNGYRVPPGEGQRKVYDPVFDDYENDEPPYVTRKAVDAMCLSCPVQQMCYDYGKNNGESGVYGGVYLTNGRYDRTRNDHKTARVIEQIKKEVGRL